MVTIRFTERLRLEPIGPQHAEALHELFRDPAVAEWYGPWTRDQVDREAARIAECWRAEGVHKWMAFDRENGTVIGRGGLSRTVIDGVERLELGWALHGRFWGRGFATEIGRAGLDLAFKELGADHVVSFTEPHNQRSRAVMERLGFRFQREFTRDGERFSLYLLRREEPSAEDRPESAAPRR